MRLAELSDMDFRDEAHFAGAAAGAMRRVLVDHARAKHAVKRGGQWHRLTLSGMGGVPDERVIDILALDEAMHRLAKLDERCVRIVELRYFGGLTIEQTARVIGVGVTTIKEKWEFARVWLRRELEQDTGS
jgi:RNA polymerase sigma factor (TIGR02999 family)